MTFEKNQAGEKVVSGFNRYMYVAFVLLGIYFLVVNRDVATAMSNLGIALVFDPFNQEQRWQNRPRYQRIWLIVHVSIVFGLLGWMGYRGFF